MMTDPRMARGSTSQEQAQRRRMLRAPRKHAGEGIEDTYNIPGIILCALSFVALALALTAAGYGFGGWAIVAGVVCAVCLIGGVTWIALESRRTQARDQWEPHQRQGH
ncbi:hypothetical protein [Nocardia sp. NRRL WC-3656]|jgi:hypothetical protein|uniref:hypothetical protein n=1 Tax=Nocardia sp. NRRL WC-3656 TaxID=1463824 RepID=UPI001E32FE36|nr:hypothetical protein [Nocardia sp. NRRL WC-3656]